MLTKLPEWIRISNPAADDHLVRKRREAVQELLATLDSSPQAILALVSAAVRGVGNNLTWEPLIAPTVQRQLSTHHPSLPAGDLKQVALDVQVTCLVALGELLSEGEGEIGEDDEGPLGDQDLETLAACASLAALSIRPETGEKFTSDATSELLRLASLRVESEARKVRERSEFDTADFDAVQPAGDVATFWAALKPVLKAAEDARLKATAVDSEEVNLLWWLTAGYSGVLRSAFREHPVALAAITAGFEMGGKAIPPPPQSARAMLGRILATSREPSEVRAPVALVDIAKEVGRERATVLVEKVIEGSSVIADFPVVFPVAWVCQRLRDGAGDRGWVEEFRTKLGYEPVHGLHSVLMASQCLDERTTWRLVAEIEER